MKSNIHIPHTANCKHFVMAALGYRVHAASASPQTSSWSPSPVNAQGVTHYKVLFTKWHEKVITYMQNLAYSDHGCLRSI